MRMIYFVSSGSSSSSIRIATSGSKELHNNNGSIRWLHCFSIFCCCCKWGLWLANTVVAVKGIVTAHFIEDESSCKGQNVCPLVKLECLHLQVNWWSWPKTRRCRQDLLKQLGRSSMMSMSMSIQFRRWCVSFNNFFFFSFHHILTLLLSERFNFHVGLITGDD